MVEAAGIEPASSGRSTKASTYLPGFLRVRRRGLHPGGFPISYLRKTSDSAPEARTDSYPAKRRHSGPRRREPR